MPAPLFHFACPGALDQPTGGYRYDWAIVNGLRAAGQEIVVHELRGRFPRPDEAARDAARNCLAAAHDAPLVIDGLALPAFASLMPAADRRIVALIHHPLALETGLGAEDRQFFAALEPRLICASNGVIVTSPATITAIRAMGVAPASIAVVMPAVTRAAIAVRRARAKLHLLSVASLTPRKAHRSLLAALARLRHRAWRLTCIGPTDLDRAEAGRIRAAVRLRGLNGRVRFTGALPAARVQAAYAHADLFVLASYYEGYGMAFAEAIASGVPVIGGRAGAVPTTVPRSAGILVRPGDVAALARALDRLLTRPDARAKLRRGAVARARGFPDWDNQARLFARTVRDLAP